MRKVQRTGHVIQPNHSNAIPRFILAVDCETNRTEKDGNSSEYAHTFRLGCVRWGRYAGGKIVGGGSIRFSSVQSFWNILNAISGPRHTTWVIGHNILFDLTLLGMDEQFTRSALVLDAPRRNRAKSESEDDEEEWTGLVVLENPPVIIGARIPRTDGRIVFVDTMNYFRCPLEEIGQQMGLEKLPLPAWSAGDDEWCDRCERDVDITFQCFIELMEWVKSNNMGMFRYTVSAQAMAAYRHRFCSTPIYFHDNLDVKKHERNAFIGGRVECFRIGRIDEDVYALDVNSLYPFIMRHNPCPYKMNWSECPDDFRPIPNGIDLNKCVAECQIDTTHGFYPYKGPNGIIYPIGQFTTYLCGPEANLAESMGHIKGIRFLANYDTEFLFSEWVDTLWGMRQGYKEAGNALYEMFVKNLLNSLFGKFAQRGSEWYPMGQPPDVLPWQQWFGPGDKLGTTEEYRTVGWHLFRKGERPELANTMIAISAFVTAYGRRYMDNLRTIAGPGNVYYQGVDGLLVNQAGMDSLRAANWISETELGKLRVTMATNQAIIHNGNDYSIGGKVVIAGRAKVVSDPSERIIKQRTFSGLAGLFKPDNRDTIVESITEWTRNQHFAKGNVQPDGTVAPIELGC